MDYVHPVEAVIPGAQGRLLATLVETTAELSLRTLARLSRVSLAQASRVLPGLVELGLVERREVPPSSLFRLLRSNVATRSIVELARSREAVLEILGSSAAMLPIPPVSVIVFGSFARRQAGPQSDLDLVIVRPDHLGEDDTRWAEGLEAWRVEMSEVVGNSVSILELSRAEVRERLSNPAPLWQDIRRDGIVVSGLNLIELAAVIHA